MRKLGENNIVLSMEEVECIEKVLNCASNMVVDLFFEEKQQEALVNKYFCEFREYFNQYKNFKASVEAENKLVNVSMRNGKYTPEERLMFLKVYVENSKCIRKAHRALIKQMGEENAPSYETFRRLIKKAEEAGVSLYES